MNHYETNLDDKTEITFKGEFELPFLLNNLLSANGGRAWWVILNV